MLTLLGITLAYPLFSRLLTGAYPLEGQEPPWPRLLCLIPFPSCYFALLDFAPRLLSMYFSFITAFLSRDRLLFPTRSPGLSFRFPLLLLHRRGKRIHDVEWIQWVIKKGRRGWMYNSLVCWGIWFAFNSCPLLFYFILRVW